MTTLYTIFGFTCTKNIETLLLNNQTAQEIENYNNILHLNCNDIINWFPKQPSEYSIYGFIANEERLCVEKGHVSTSTECSFLTKN